jgi:hypothetical protein
MKNEKVVKTILFAKDFFDRSNIRYEMKINEKNEISISPR